MVKIHVATDCGNAPKKEFLRDFEIAFAQQNSQAILDSFSEEIVWEMVGEMNVSGKSEAAKLLTTMIDGTMTELSLENIITHGDTGCVSGTMQFSNGKKYAFCDIFTFTSHAKNAVLKKLSSFVIELK